MNKTKKTERDRIDARARELLAEDVKDAWSTLVSELGISNERARSSIARVRRKARARQPELIRRRNQ
jgi:DNA/RNA-binding domain of Phe-tRNA-synthetase-like protein